MKEINYTVENGVALMSIDRPKALNALSRTIVDDMDKLLEKIKADVDIKVLVIYNEGNFAAGADIGGMAECDEEGAKAFSFSPTFNKLEALGIPTIAAIEGFALGGGLELALACDMRIAAENAKLGFPEINLGIMPGAGGTVRAARLIGISKAKELIFMGSNISAQQALAIGLINAAVPQDEVKRTALKWAEKIAQKGTVAMRTAKRTIDAAAEANVLDGVEIEASNWASLFNTEDQKEGMRAFLEKRKPVYKGK